MATLTATADPSYWPPRVRLDLDAVTVGETFASIVVRRNGVLLREQPYAGGSTAVTYDYEAPRGVPLTYTAEVSKSAWSTLRAETWANLTGWSTTSGTPSVSSGRLTTTSAVADAIVSRSIAASAVRRILIPNPEVWATDRIPGATLRVGAFLLTRGTSAWGAGYGSLGSSTIISTLSGPTTITITATRATVTSSAGTAVIERSGISPFADTDLIATAASTNPGQTYVGQFTVEEATSAVATLSDTTQLDDPRVWLINPVAPLLSMPIDSGDCTGSDDRLSVVWSSGQRKESRANRNLHTPVGRRRAVAITTGPRSDYGWSLTINAPTLNLKRAVLDLLDNQSPLLLLQPPTVEWDLEDGWYSVGDVPQDRESNYAVRKDVQITLPLEPSDPPAVSQGAVRTWGDVLSEAATWADLQNVYDTWTEVLAGP